MHLFFTALQDKADLRSFSFKPANFEEGLDFLNFVVNQGHVLINAHLVDEYSAIELPLDAFDGTPFSTPIKNLEQEWQDLLSEPVHQDSLSKYELIEWAMKRIQNCEARIENQIVMADRFEALLKRAQETLLLEPERTRLILHYQAQITCCHNQLAQSQVCRKRLDLHLIKLLAL